MRIIPIATIVAGSALIALAASAQTTTPTKDGAKTTQSSSNQPASKQRTQGLPPSTSNPQYGGAQKQQTSVPTSLAHDPQYGGAQKQQ